MGGLMSRNKGKRAEREVIAMLQPILDMAYDELAVDRDMRVRLQRNTMQSDGGGFDIHGLHWMAPEVKHQEVLHCAKWFQQACDQAKANQTPVLFYRRNNVKWRVRMWSRLTVAENITHLFQADMAIEDFLVYFKHKVYFELRKEIGSGKV